MPINRSKEGDTIETLSSRFPHTDLFEHIIIKFKNKKVSPFLALWSCSLSGENYRHHFHTYLNQFCDVVVVAKASKL